MLESLAFHRTPEDWRCVYILDWSNALYSSPPTRLRESLALHQTLEDWRCIESDLSCVVLLFVRKPQQYILLCCIRSK